MPTIDHLTQAADRKHAMPSDAGATLFAALELSLTSWVLWPVHRARTGQASTPWRPATGRGCWLC